MAAINLIDGMDVSSLRLLLNTMEFGSVSQAARRMHVTQPSATAKLQKLERQLGVPLLERGRSGSRPTDVGSRLAPLCADVITAVEELIDRAEALRTERDRLSVAATRHVADHFLPIWVADLDIDPVRLDLHESTTREVARAVRTDVAAVGFSEGPDAPLGLGSAIVATEQIVPVVGRDHPWWTRRVAVGADELAGSTAILAAPGSGTRDVVEAVLGAVAERRGDVVEVATSSGARLGALAGVGVAYLPRCWTSDAIARGSMRELPVEVEIDQPVRVVWRGNEPTSPAARRLVDLLTSGAAAAGR